MPWGVDPRRRAPRTPRPPRGRRNEVVRDSAGEHVTRAEERGARHRGPWTVVKGTERRPTRRGSQWVQGANPGAAGAGGVPVGSRAWGLRSLEQQGALSAEEPGDRGRAPGKCAPGGLTAPGGSFAAPLDPKRVPRGLGFHRPRAVPGGRSHRSRLTDLTGGDHGLFSGTECVMSHVTVSCPRGGRLQAAEPPCTGRAPTASGHTRLQPEPRAAGPAPPPSAHASPWRCLVPCPTTEGTRRDLVRASRGLLVPPLYHRLHRCGLDVQRLELRRRWPHTPGREDGVEGGGHTPQGGRTGWRAAATSHLVALAPEHTPTHRHEVWGFRRPEIPGLPRVPVTLSPFSAHRWAQCPFSGRAHLVATGSCLSEGT